MRRLVPVIAASLAALTVLALLGAAVAVRPPGPPAEADGLTRFGSAPATQEEQWARRPRRRIGGSADVGIVPPVG